MNDVRDDSRLIELAALPAGDPRRVEAAKDPRVRAWLLEHDAFLEDAPLDPAEAESVRRAAEAALTQAHAGPARGPERVVALPRPKRARAGLPRWALAAAAFAVITGVAVVLPRLAPRDRADNLRSLAPEGNAAPFASRAATLDAAGRLVLRWSREPRATSYRVQVLRGLDEAAAFDAGADDSLVLDPARLPREGVLLWRVQALRDGEPVAATGPRELPR